MIKLIPLAALALASAVAAAPPPASVWEIGPIIRGRNYSLNMPPRPLPVRGGLAFDFPYPSAEAGHVHYLTFRHGSLGGKTRIVMRYRIDAERGVRFVPQEQPDLPAKLSLFFQQSGDTWSGRRRFASYRWYSPGARLGPVATGMHELIVRLDDPDWSHVQGQPAGANRAAFADAIADTDRIGFVLGSPAARGHGVYATGPARFTLLEFRVE